MAGISKAERERRAAAKAAAEAHGKAFWDAENAKDPARSYGCVNAGITGAIQDVIDRRIDDRLRLQATLGCLLCARGKDEAELFDNAIAMADRLLARITQTAPQSPDLSEKP